MRFLGGTAEGAGVGVDDDYVGWCVGGDVGGHRGGEDGVAGVSAEDDRAGVRFGGSAKDLVGDVGVGAVAVE